MLATVAVITRAQDFPLKPCAWSLRKVKCRSVWPAWVTRLRLRTVRSSCRLSEGGNWEVGESDHRCKSRL